jgi:hypothetical protein
MSGAEPIIAAEAAAAIGATEAAAATAAAAEAAAATAAATEAATAMQAAQTAATAANTASPFLTGGIEQAAAEGMRGYATQAMAGLPPAGPYELAGGSLMPGINPSVIAPGVGKAATGLTMMQGIQAARALGSLGPKQQTTVGMQMRRGQPVNMMQPASLLEQKRKRNPIISLL